MELRKAKKEESLLKRRNVNVSDGEDTDPGSPIQDVSRVSCYINWFVSTCLQMLTQTGR